MLINILTWNTCITEWKDYDKERYNKIVNFIKNFLDSRENPVVFLQQIPYKFTDENGQWKESDIYLDIREYFAKYKILFNSQYNRGNIRMATMVILKNDVDCDDLDETFYPEGRKSSREYAVKIKEIKGNKIIKEVNFLGIHARNGCDNRKYLKALDSFGKADILLGDFNAGNYPECENRLTFNNILKDYICICNIPTRKDPFSQRRTCIDHIFVKGKLISKCSGLIVHEGVELSDHFPISFSLSLE